MAGLATWGDASASTVMYYRMHTIGHAGGLCREHEQPFRYVLHRQSVMARALGGVRARRLPTHDICFVLPVQYKRDVPISKHVMSF